MNFCNKNVLFLKNYTIFSCVNVSEGSFDQFAYFANANPLLNEINITRQGTVNTVLVYLEFIQKVSHSNS